ncbi:hypothetical protein KAU43_06350 [candidate division WOR-3 bacterium]|nr:hypothetical protein [candidate division WOR-3 bacterium]
MNKEKPNSVKCPQCNEVMEQFEGIKNEAGNPEKLFYCHNGHGTWCDDTIRLTRAIQRKKKDGMVFLYCSTCRTRKFHARVSKGENDYWVCDTCSKTTKCTIADFEQECNCGEPKCKWCRSQ